MTDIRLCSGMPAILAAAILTVQETAAQNLSWATSYSGIKASAMEEVEGIVADGSGNVFATGLSGGKGIGSGIRTMKLDANGTIQWNVIHSQAALCGGMWGRTPLALDSAGNLVVVGAEFTSTMDDWNPVILKLSPAGATLARLVFDLGPFASFDAVAIDATGTYILAHNNPNNGRPHIVHTLKLGPDGAVLWRNSFTPGTFWGTRGGIAVTASGVFTAAGGKFIAHDLNNGGLLWHKDLLMPNGGSALAADGTGNIYLATQDGVVKFDSEGNAAVAIGSIANQVSDLDVDAAGNLYLVGSTPATSSRGSDVLTQKFNPIGRLVWSATYGKNGQYSNDGIAVSARGAFVYVGCSKYNKNLDMCALKYIAGN